MLFRSRRDSIRRTAENAESRVSRWPLSATCTSSTWHAYESHATHAPNMAGMGVRQTMEEFTGTYREVQAVRQSPLTLNSESGTAAKRRCGHTPQAQRPLGLVVMKSACMRTDFRCIMLVDKQVNECLVGIGSLQYVAAQLCGQNQVQPR